jgi:hypothetical protein
MSLAFFFLFLLVFLQKTLGATPLTYLCDVARPQILEPARKTQTMVETLLLWYLPEEPEIASFYSGSVGHIGLINFQNYPWSSRSVISRASSDRWILSSEHRQSLKFVPLRLALLAD